MPIYLYTVDDVFNYSGQYLIPVPGVPISIKGIRKGLSIDLRRPDGTILQTVVACLPIIDPYDPNRPIQIAVEGITKQDIPIGTEIWMND